jgi:hypothetical protein
MCQREGGGEVAAQLEAASAARSLRRCNDAVDESPDDARGFPPLGGIGER